MAEVKLNLDTDHVQIDKSQYPSNSHKSKADIEGKKVKKIISGKAIKKKKPFYKRVVASIVGEEVEDIPTFIIYDILIPALKQAIDDAVGGILFGNSRRSRRSRSDYKGAGHISYGKYYDDKREPRREANYRGRYTFDEIILDDRAEATEVLDTLLELVSQYDMASVADLYDMVGFPINHTDNKYGWTNLSDADISPMRGGGWLIDLPKPHLLD